MLKLTTSALSLLKDRYFLEGEDWKGMWDRIFKHIVPINEPFRDEMYNMFLEGEAIPNTPTMMNAGVDDRTSLSACYVQTMPTDSLQGISKTQLDIGETTSAGGGCGTNFSKLRPNNSKVKGYEKLAAGPIGILKMYDNYLGILKQGKRNGALMAILNDNHPDILKFITAKSEDLNSIKNANLSVMYKDNFFEKMINGSDEKVEVEFGGEKSNLDVSYKELFEIHCQSAWECGGPGVLFYDTINKNYPKELSDRFGPIQNTNPCGEQPLLENQTCNLGHINLLKMFDPGTGFDYDKFSDRLRLLVRFLDLIIDKYQHPLDEQNEMHRITRNIGVGLTGLAEVLVELGIVYGSSESILFSNSIGRVWEAVTIKASQELGIEKGIPEINVNNQRNTIIRTIAPTGSTSLILGLDGAAIEPYFDLEFNRIDHKGIIYLYNVMNNRINKNPIYYVTSMNVSPEKHIRIQATFQKYCDSAISKTINLPEDATVEDVKKVFILAYKQGCKGTTIYRNNCRKDQVLKSNKNVQLEEFYDIWRTHKDGIVKNHVKLPKEFPMYGYNLASEKKKWYILIAFKDKGLKRPFALFIKTKYIEENIDAEKIIHSLTKLAESKNISKDFMLDNELEYDSKYKIQSNTDKIGCLFSLCLRHNIQIQDIVEVLDNIKDLSISSLVIRIKKLLIGFIQEGTKTKGKCLECGQESLAYQVGCVSCLSCGWAKC